MDGQSISGGSGDSDLAPIKPQCPHCHSVISIASESENEIVCPSCGSSFQLDPHKTTSWEPGKLPDLGKFSLKEVVGRGAFGVVYRAHDNELQRTVAIKIPRSGAFRTKVEEDRFVREARNTAQLAHASIVSVFEVGRGDDFPYIVSEFVEGSTLADVLTAKSFTARQSASLMADIAAALEHAHQHGVVHRDLKPSNIMLERQTPDSGSSRKSSGSTVSDSRVQTIRNDLSPAGYHPRVMDFGLARRDMGEVTMTIEGQILGTPAYMSPEQAQGDGHRADARSDIYSLGVILFELLTGELPFRGNKRMLLDQVIHDEPPSPRRLNSSVPADLETICLRCLEKSPGRRLATAGELRNELLRHLRGEPIHSRPISAVERIWRWSIRHRAVALSGATIVAVFATAFLLVAISRSREHAARIDAEEMRQRAEARLATSSELVDRYLTAISEDPRLRAVGVEEVRSELLVRVCRFYDDLAQEFPADPETAAKRGAAYGRLAGVYVELGQLPEASQAYQEGLVILQTLDTGNGTKAAYLEHLAKSWGNLGVLQKRQGQVDEAEASYRKAIAIYDRLFARFPDRDEEYEGSLAGHYLNLGNLTSDLHRYEEAERDYEQALEIFERLSDGGTNGAQVGNVASVKNSLAILARQTGNLQRAEQLYREALAARRKAVAADPTSPKLRDELAATLHNQAIAQINLEHFEQAEQFLIEGRNIRLQLSEEHPDVPHFQSGVDKINRNLARLYAATNRVEEAATLYEQSIERFQRLTATYPDVAEFQYGLAMQHRSVGNLQLQSGNLKLCLEATQEAIRILKELTANHPEVYGDDLAETRLNEVNLLRDLGQIDAAAEAVPGLLELLHRLREDVRTRQRTNYLAHAYLTCGQLQRDKQKPDQSLASYDQAESLLGELLILDPQDWQVTAELVNCFSQRGESLAELGHLDQAWGDWQRLLELVDDARRDDVRLPRAIFMAHHGRYLDAAAEAQSLAITSKESPTLHYNLACVFAQAAVAVGRDDTLEAAESTLLVNRYHAEALDHLTRAIALGFNDFRAMASDPDLESLKELPGFMRLAPDSEAAPSAER